MAWIQGVGAVTRGAIGVASALVVATVLTAGCDGGGATSPPVDPPVETSGGRVEISVLPLTLEGTTGVCYALEVYNGATDANGFPTPERVWARDNVCSGVFGNGALGGITYIGPCDADEPNNFVTLGIETVAGAGGVPLVEGEQWFNPCPLDNRCELYAPCVENADTPVTFNLTIMRSANQGFFDVAVRFDQVYCSAKIDCSYDHFGLEPVRLLHGRDGNRAETAVVSVACTTGPWLTDNTEMYLNHVRVRCDEPIPSGTAWELAPAPAGQEGNHWDVAAVPPTSALWQYATYFGNEVLYCDGLPCGKKYVDIAVGYDPAAVGCTLEVEMSVAKPGLFVDFNSPLGSAYPVLVGRVQLTPEAEGAAPTGLPLCRKGGMNDPWSGFYTTYTAPSNEGVPFCFRFDGTSFEPRPDGACDVPGHYEFLDVQPLLCAGGPATLHGPGETATLLGDPTSGCTGGPVNPSFQCAPLSFVPGSTVCDGFADCDNGADEQFGACATVIEDCADGLRVFSTDEACDGVPDCLDGSDEADPLAPGCTTDLLPCGSGDGFHVLSQQCDGVIDCRNGHDELVVPGCPTPVGPCMTGDEAILVTAQCDGWPDCGDGSDELGCP